MATSLWLYRAPQDAGPMNGWDSMRAEPLGTATSVKQIIEKLWPGLRWSAGSEGSWSARGEEARGRHIEASVMDFEGACHFVVLRATPVSVIRETMQAMGLNHVCDPEAGCLVDPFAYEDDDRYYVRKS